MKVVTPTRLLAEAADVLVDVRDDVVVVGAAALEVALSDVESVAVTPTRDVDVVVPTERAAEVVARLEAADLHRSELKHERDFTWVRGDLKVQLMRSLHPFPKPPASELPGNPVFAMAGDPVHQVTVAFSEAPTQPRLHCANVACLLALKQAAFGRTRAPDGAPIERDYHDAYLLMANVPDALRADYMHADHGVRTRAMDAIRQLAAGDDATIAAARQMVRLRAAVSQRVAEATVRRAASQAQKLLSEPQ